MATIDPFLTVFFLSRSWWNCQLSSRRSCCLFSLLQTWLALTFDRWAPFNSSVSWLNRSLHQYWRTQKGTLFFVTKSTWLVGRWLHMREKGVAVPGRSHFFSFYIVLCPLRSRLCPMAIVTFTQKRVMDTRGYCVNKMACGLVYHI